MSSLLIHLYPARWRDRYGDEFAALLGERALGPLDVADVILGALDAQLRLRGHDTGIARGKGFIMSLRIGGLAAILGAALWAVAGLVNSGVFVDVDATAPTILLLSGMLALLVALGGLSAFQARTNPTLSWVAFAVPAIGTLATFAGLGAIYVNQYDEIFWLLFGLGGMTAIIGSVLFAIATFRTAALSRGGAALLGCGAVLVMFTLPNAGAESLAAVGLASFALGWFVLGVQAIRTGGPAAAPRIA